MKTTLSTLLSLPVTDVLGGGADLRLLSEYPSAVCLDGSSAGYYFRPGSVASKWLFSLEGGGECVNKEDCAARAQGDLGSSLAYPATVDLKGLQTADSTVNPFAGWNQVHIKYCSGDLHMGQQEVASDGMDGMKFAGHLIVDSVLEELRAKENLGSADTVIWSGQSAGGMGCFSSLDFVADKLENATVVGVPIGGFYFSNEMVYQGTADYPQSSYIPWTFDALEDYYNLWKAFVPLRCASQMAGSTWKCMLASGGSYTSLNTAVFIVEAQTDKVVMPLHDGLPKVWDQSPPLCSNTVEGCPPEIVEYMESWRDSMLGALKEVQTANRGDGIFNPSCLIHTSFSSDKPLINKLNYMQALEAWINEPSSGSDHYYIDDCGEVMCGTC